MLRRFAGPGLLLLMVLLAGAACGGGDDASKGAGQRITDPAKVPSSTPIQGATLYRIQGDTVSISGGTPAALPGGVGAGATPASTTYTVKSGDTCGGIASQFKITTDELLRANRTIDAGCTNLKPGDTLRIPGASSTTGSTGVITAATPRPTGKSYTVVSGDTCDAIARSYGVDLQKLVAANGNLNCANLQIGQVVNIP